jgi:hypothetical protein
MRRTVFMECTFENPGRDGPLRRRGVRMRRMERMLRICSASAPACMHRCRLRDPQALLLSCCRAESRAPEVRSRLYPAVSVSSVASVHPGSVGLAAVHRSGQRATATSQESARKVRIARIGSDAPKPACEHSSASELFEQRRDGAARVGTRYKVLGTGYAVLLRRGLPGHTAYLVLCTVYPVPPWDTAVHAGHFRSPPLRFTVHE